MPAHVIINWAVGEIEEPNDEVENEENVQKLSAKKERRLRDRRLPPWDVRYDIVRFFNHYSPQSYILFYFFYSVD